MKKQDRKNKLLLKKVFGHFLISYIKWILLIIVSVLSIDIVFHNSTTYNYYKIAINQALSPELWNILGTISFLILGIGIIIQKKELLNLSGNFFYYTATMGLTMIGVLIAQITLAFEVSPLEPLSNFLWGLRFSLAFFIFSFLVFILWIFYYFLNMDDRIGLWLLKLNHFIRISIGLSLVLISLTILYKPHFDYQVKNEQKNLSSKI